MKFFLPVALLAAAVSAQSAADCDAANIVEACLTSETAKMTNCGTADYDCQCAAAQAIATCYNNCPNDTRKAGADGDVQIYCGQASVYGNKATAKVTQTSGSAEKTTEATPTDDTESTAAGGAAPSETSPGGAAERAMNAGAMLLAVAGAMAVVV